MQLDIRYPLGMSFLAIGLVLLVTGVATRGSAMYAASGGIDLNLVWGLAMCGFGGAMLLLARRARTAPRTPRTAPRASGRH